MAFQNFFKSVCILICLTTILWIPASSFSQTYNLATDFSPENNPNGPWSYGSSDNRGSTFTIYSNGYKINDDIESWSNDSSGRADPPHVIHNSTSSDVTVATYIIPAGKVASHPGSNGENSVIRWTAPKSGTVQIDAVFTGINTSKSTVDVAILHDSQELWSDSINSYDVPFSASESLSVNDNETIDFTVGYGSNGNYHFDSTGVDVTISYNSTVIPVNRSFSSSCYFAGGEISVSLTATPASGTMNYLIEDTPPAGWTVSNISHSGAFDEATGKVKFGPFFDSTARNLTYDLTIPATETGDKTFSGKAFADTTTSDITEQAVLSQCSLYHPADTDEDSSLSGGEVAAYGAAWKKGMEWTAPPNPIPISYVTRAGALWKGGEAYKIDLTAGEPPLCWVADSKRRSGRNGMRDSESSAVREISSDAYLMGQEFTVTVSVKPSDTVQVYAMEEETPQEWTVSVSDPGYFDAVNNKVKFGPFMDNEERTLTYQITSPRGASGEFSLSGIASFDGSDLEISENSTVTIVGADINDDGKADLADVILALRISAGFDDFEVNRNEDEKIGIAEAICILQKLAM